MVCPICTVAVGLGVGILEELGVSDIIIGIWVGAFIVSLIWWTIDYLDRKNIHFLFRKILVIIAYYGIIIAPLYFWKIRDKIVMTPLLMKGIIIGTIVFILAVLANSYLKKINDGKVIIKFQKVIVPIAFLIVASAISYLILMISSV